MINQDPNSGTGGFYDALGDSSDYSMSKARSSDDDLIRQHLVDEGQWDMSWDTEDDVPGITDPGEKKTLDWFDAWSGGFGDILSDMTPFVAGVKELSEAKGLWEAADRVKNETATNEDYALIQSFMEEASADKTVGYHIGSILRALPAFGIEMAAGMGLVTKGAKGAAKLGMESLQTGLAKTMQERALANIARKELAQASALEIKGDAMGAALKRKAAEQFQDIVLKQTPAKAIKEAAKLATASTIGSEAITSVAGGLAGQGWGGRSQADAYRRAFQKSGMYMDKDEAGNLSFKFTDTLESFWDSLPAGIANTFVEHVTERMGSSLMRLPVINRLEGLQATIATKFMGKNGMKPGEFMRFLDKFGWDGPIEEFLEERAGGIVRGITFVGEDEWYIGSDEDGYHVRTEQLFPDWRQWTGELSAFAISGQGASALHSYFSGDADPLANARAGRQSAEIETALNRTTFETKLAEAVNPETKEPFGEEVVANFKNGRSSMADYQKIADVINKEGYEDLKEAAVNAGIRGFRDTSPTVESAHQKTADRWVKEVEGDEAKAKVVMPSTTYQRQLVEQFKDYADVVFIEGGSAFEGQETARWSSNQEDEKAPHYRGTVYINSGLREDTADEGALALLKKAFHETTHEYQWLDDKHKAASIDALFEKDSSLVDTARLEYFTPFIVNAPRVTTVKEEGVEGEEGYSKETVEDDWSPNFFMMNREEKLEEVERYKKEIWNPKQKDPEATEKKELQAAIAEEYTELIEFLNIDNGKEYIDKLKERNPRVIERIRDFFANQVNRFRSDDNQIATGVDARIERLEKQIMGVKSNSDSFEIASVFNEAMNILGSNVGRRTQASDEDKRRAEQAGFDSDKVSDENVGLSEEMFPDEGEPTAEDVANVETVTKPLAEAAADLSDLKDMDLAALRQSLLEIEQDAITDEEWKIWGNDYSLSKHVEKIRKYSKAKLRELITESRTMPAKTVDDSGVEYEPLKRSSKAVKRLVRKTRPELVELATQEGLFSKEELAEWGVTGSDTFISKAELAVKIANKQRQVKRDMLEILAMGRPSGRSDVEATEQEEVVAQAPRTGQERALTRTDYDFTGADAYREQIKVVRTTTRRVAGNDPKNQRTDNAAAWYDRKENAIYLNEEVARKKYEEKAWTEPKVNRVYPLAKNTFNSYEEWEQWLVDHEQFHAMSPVEEQRPANALFENRANARASAYMRLDRGLGPFTAKSSEVHRLTKMTRDRLEKLGTHVGLPDVSKETYKSKKDLALALANAELLNAQLGEQGEAKGRIPLDLTLEAAPQLTREQRAQESRFLGVSGRKQRELRREQTLRGDLPTSAALMPEDDEEFPQTTPAQALQPERVDKMLSQMERRLVDLQRQKAALASTGEGINISSYEKGLGAQLTNPSPLPVNFRGTQYPSAEAAYQATKGNQLDDVSVLALMTEVIAAKLDQHPQLRQEITNRGGLDFLAGSTHNLVRGGKTVKTDRWTGKDGLFMRALRAAYEPTLADLDESQSDEMAAIDADIADLEKDIADVKERRSAVTAANLSELYPEGSEKEVQESYHAISRTDTGEEGLVTEYLGGMHATPEEAAEALARQKTFIFGQTSLEAIGSEGAPLSVSERQEMRAISQRDQNVYERLASEAHDESYPVYVTLKEFEVAMRNRYGKDWENKMTTESKDGGGGQKGVHESLMGDLSAVIGGRGFDRLKSRTTVSLNRDQFINWVNKTNAVRYAQEQYDQPTEMRTGDFEGAKDYQEFRQKAAQAERGRLRSKLPEEEQGAFRRSFDNEEMAALARAYGKKQNDLKRAKNVTASQQGVLQKGKRLNEEGSPKSYRDKTLAEYEAARTDVLSGTPTRYRLHGSSGIDRGTGIVVNRDIQIVKGHELGDMELVVSRYAQSTLAPDIGESFETEEYTQTDYESINQRVADHFGFSPEEMGAALGEFTQQELEDARFDVEAKREEFYLDGLFLDEPKERISALNQRERGEEIDSPDLVGTRDPVTEQTKSDRFKDKAGFEEQESPNLGGSYEQETIPGVVETDRDGNEIQTRSFFGGAEPATQLRSAGEIEAEKWSQELDNLLGLEFQDLVPLGEMIGMGFQERRTVNDPVPMSVLKSLDHHRDWDYVNNKPVLGLSSKKRHKLDASMLTPNDRKTQVALSREKVAAAARATAESKSLANTMVDVFSRLLDDMSTDLQREDTGDQSVEQARRANLLSEIEGERGAFETKTDKFGKEYRDYTGETIRTGRRAITDTKQVVKLFGNQSIAKYLDDGAQRDIFSEEFFGLLHREGPIYRQPTVADLHAVYKSANQAAKNLNRIAREANDPKVIGARFGVGSDMIRKAQESPWRYTYVVSGEGMRRGELPVGQFVRKFTEEGGSSFIQEGRSIPTDAAFAQDVRTIFEEANATKAQLESFDRIRNIASTSGIARLTENEAAELEKQGYKMAPLDGMREKHFGPNPFSALMYGSSGNNREFFLKNPEALDTWLVGIAGNLTHVERVKRFGHDLFAMSREERFIRTIQHLEAEDRALADYVLSSFVTRLNPEWASSSANELVNVISVVLANHRVNDTEKGREGSRLQMLKPMMPPQEQRRRMRFGGASGQLVELRTTPGFVGPGRPVLPSMPLSMGEGRLRPTYPTGRRVEGPAKQPVIAELPGGISRAVDEYEAEAEAFEFDPVDEGQVTLEAAPQMSPFARQMLSADKEYEYGKKQRFLETFVNRYLPFTEWEKRLEAKGITIPRHMRLALRQAMKRGELSSQQDLTERRLFKPLAEVIDNQINPLGSRKRMKFKDADRIALLKSVQEKHDVLIDRQDPDNPHPMSAMPTGIDPVKALEELKEFERKYGKEHVDAFEKIVMKISAETREVWRRSGLVSERVINFLEKHYPHYVPYREQEMAELEEWSLQYSPQDVDRGSVLEEMSNFIETLASSSSYQTEDRGSDMRQSMFKTQLGMSKVPEDSPLLMLMAQLNHALGKEKDAEISRAVVDLIKLGEDKLGVHNIGVIVPEEKKVTRRAVRKKTDPDGPAEIIGKDVKDPNFENNPLVYVAAGKDGERVVVEFHPQYAEIAAALKSQNMSPSSQKGLLEFLGQITKFIGGMITRWNPAFSIPNFVRDTSTASMHITSEYGAKVASEMFLRPRLLSSVMTLWKANKAIANGTYDPELPEFANDPEMVLFERYKASGAPVTFLDLGKTRGLEDWFKDVHQSYSPPQINQLQFWKGKVTDIKTHIESFNDAFENATRFSYFKYGLEKGLPSKLVEGEDMDEQELAMGAKNLTVNFEQKGVVGASLNSLFMFANANIQSNARLFDALFVTDKKGNRSFQPHAKSLMAGIVTLHAAMAVMNAAIGGVDPEDDEAYWAKIPDWDKRANLILMNWMGQDGKAIKIPLPYGYNFFAAIGNMFGEVWSGTKRGEEVAPYLFETGLQAFSPIGGGTDLTDMLTPTIAKPLFEIRNNRDWKGSAIYKDRYGDETIPDSELAFDSVSKRTQAFTDWLNEATGGNKDRAGSILGVDTSINPASIEHLAQFLGGGIGKELFRVAKIKEKIGEGEKVEIGDVPLVRRFALTPTKYAAASLYRERRDKIEVVENMRKSGMKLSEEDEQLYSLSAARKVAERNIKSIRQQRKRYERGSEEYKKAEERERSVQNAFNKRWNEIFKS